MSNRKTISFNRDHKLVKAFHWAWDTYPTDTCKLVWGLLFIWLAAIFNGIEAVVDAVSRRRRSRARAVLLTDSPSEDPSEVPASRKRARLQWVVNAAEWFVNYIYQPTKRFFQKTKIFWEVLGFALLLAYVGLIVTLIVIGFIHHPITGLIFVGALVICGAIIVLIVHFENPIRRFFRRMREIIRAGYDSIHNRTCALVEIEQ